MSLKQEINAGLSISVTGKFSRQGQQALDGIRLWQSYMNAQGGISLGAQGQRPVRLTYYDDQSLVSRAQQNVLKLLKQDRVDILFGPYSSALTMAAARVAQAHRKLLWNYGGSSDEIFNLGQRYLVSTASPASEYLRDFPHWLAKESPCRRRICIVHSTRGTFASQVVRGVVESARIIGFYSIELVPINSPLRSADAIVRELCSVDPEVLVLVGSFQDEVRIMRARHFWPGTLSEVAAVAAGVQAFYEEINEKAEGVIGPSQWEPEGRFGEKQEPDSNWFVRNFQERFGPPPDYTAAGSFAIGLVLAECIRQAGSLQDKLLFEVAAELDFKTFYGRFRIDPSTGLQIGHRILLTQWQQGRKVVLKGGEAP